MKNVLVIIDPQVDFIKGTMAVEWAIEKMEALKKHIKDFGSKYDGAIITLDWHPENHCSFSQQGGPWPKHCVAYTPGALPYPRLFDEVLEAKNTHGWEIVIKEKGKDPEKEEYGAFDDYESPGSWRLLLSAGKIYMTGIMSEYCVLESLKGIVEKYPPLKENIIVLLPYIATMDGHKSLKEYCDSEGITYTD